MKLSHSVKNGICFVAVEGSLIAQDAIEFKTEIFALLENTNCRGLVVNCQQLHEIRSAGLGYLAMLSLNAEKMQKGFALFQLSESLRAIFQTTNLDKKIQIFDTEEDALNYW
ncbi:MAG: STAS domain-containing protein [SAR324 cluster bacterium]|nr:STAS domain-containing protein [SAR324 cluster bacterium]